MIRPFPAAIVALFWMAPAALGAPPDPAVETHHIYLAGQLLLSHPRFSLDQDGDGPSLRIDIRNRGKAPDRLLGGTVDGAAQTVLVGGDSDGSLFLQPRATQSMTRGGVQFVTHGWTDPAAADGRLGATLRFARAGDVRVSFKREDGPDAQPQPDAAASEKEVDIAH